MPTGPWDSVSPPTASANPGRLVSTAVASAQLRTEAPSTPMVSKLVAKGRQPSASTSPGAGFKATNPQNAAGIRSEPAVSVASASGVTPAATATADPDEEPPGLSPGSIGFRQGGNPSA